MTTTAPRGEMTVGNLFRHSGVVRRNVKQFREWLVFKARMDICITHLEVRE